MNLNDVLAALKKCVLRCFITFVIAALFSRGCTPFLDCRAGGNGIQPAFQVGFVIQGLLLTFPKRRSAPNGHIGDGIEITCNEFMIGHLAI